MSSGEADAYVSLPVMESSNSTSNCWPVSTGSTYAYTYAKDRYFYQITCPRCKSLNWAELDIVISCKGAWKQKVCGAKLKAVKETVDYEVFINI